MFSAGKRKCQAGEMQPLLFQCPGEMDGTRGLKNLSVRLRPVLVGTFTKTADNFLSALVIHPVL